GSATACASPPRLRSLISLVASESLLARTFSVPSALGLRLNTMTFSARYRALVYASLVASFLVVVWGGIVRVTGSGLGCPDWPLCHGQFLPSLDPATRIEWFHRFLAIAGGVTVAAVVLWSLIVYRADRRILTLAIIAAIVYPLQADERPQHDG